MARPAAALHSMRSDNLHWRADARDACSTRRAARIASLTPRVRHRSHRTKRHLASLALTTCLLAAGAASAQRPSAHQPVVSLAQATVIAVGRVPGTMVHSELEFENHRWIYSFEIRRADRVVMEVNVDSDTGQIVEVSPD